MEIFTKSGIYIANIDKILTCDIEERLDGVLKMNFETLITDELLNLVSGNEYMVLYNTDYYDVVSIQKSLSGGMYKIKFTCEHISYRLSDASKPAFTMTGTSRELLNEILKDTNFIVGSSDVDGEFTISLQQECTIRSILFNLASIMKCDVDFKGYYVSLFQHKGSVNPIEVIDNNVVSISSTLKATEERPSYSITIRPTTKLTLGDQLHLKFTRLGIDEYVRLIGIKRKPFNSKDYDIQVGLNEDTLENDLVAIRTEVVSKDKAYFGVKISSDDGLTITRADQSAKVIMNAEEFRMQAKDNEGILQDRLYFDPETGNYRFAGTVTIDGGTININDNFKVDSLGNVYLNGSSTIYGGKYYAGNNGVLEGYSQMTGGGYEVFNSENDLKIRLGYTTDGEDYPFIQLGSGSGEFTDFGLVKKFTDGLWIGNSEPADVSGNFDPKKGYNGIFFRFSDNTAYVVKDTEMNNIYTGAAIAKFG